MIVLLILVLLNIQFDKTLFSNNIIKMSKSALLVTENNTLVKISMNLNQKDL